MNVNKVKTFEEIKKQETLMERERFEASRKFCASENKGDIPVSKKCSSLYFFLIMQTCISTLCVMKNNLLIYAFLNDTGVLKFALSACVSVWCANKLVKTVFQFAIVVYSMSSFDGKCKAVHHGSTAVFCTFQQSDYACVLSPVY